MNLQRERTKLLSMLKEAFDKYKNLPILYNTLPKTMNLDNTSIKFVFIGQYSSGKSSIIKMLIEIDIGIKTQETHKYRWNEIEIIDTPGIYTELCPDYDENYEANY
ncbi:GTPase domain-containing protein [Pectinatus frisingensis]|uniref:GTPase domain-containing protein n=1 Tax=Pectinatus frisingensis TaxID=865 RepID=UPI003D8040C7